jgi:hypothetical protein
MHHHHDQSSPLMRESIWSSSWAHTWAPWKAHATPSRNIKAMWQQWVGPRSIWTGGNTSAPSFTNLYTKRDLCVCDFVCFVLFVGMGSHTQTLPIYVLPFFILLKNGLSWLLLSIRWCACFAHVFSFVIFGPTKQKPLNLVHDLFCY